MSKLATFESLLLGKRAISLDGWKGTIVHIRSDSVYLQVDDTEELQWAYIAGLRILQ